MPLLYSLFQWSLGLRNFRRPTTHVCSWHCERDLKFRGGFWQIGVEFEGETTGVENPVVRYDRRYVLFRSGTADAFQSKIVVVL
jgi:hypothetical protein